MPASLTCLSTNAARAFLDVLIPAFTREQGLAVVVNNGTTQQLLQRIGQGETGDVVIATIAGMDELTQQHKLVPASRASLGSTCVGIGVRAGASHPDITTVEAFTRALLAAKSIAYTTLGQSGIHFERVVEQLGIAAQLKPKYKLILGGLVGELVLKGEAEMGVQMLSEILAVPGFELVGPFPRELNEVTAFEAALLMGTREADAAQTFVRFLTTPEARRIMHEKGFEVS